MLGSTIFKEHKIPTPPMGTDQSEERFMRVLGPILGDQQREIAAPDIDRPMGCDRAGARDYAAFLGFFFLEPS